MHRTWVKWVITLGVGLLIYLLPRPDLVTQDSWTLLAVFISTIVGSIIQPMPGSAIVLLGVVALALSRAVPIEKALSGYADKYVWLVLAAFFISRAMIKTGLGHRIALIFVRLIGRKTLGLGYALVFTDLILASFIPSTGARSGGIILPIARSVTETYDSRPEDFTENRLGTFLMTMLYQCEVILCATFLTGQASNVIIRGFAADNAGIDLNYSAWFAAAIVPSIISLVAIPLMIYRFFPPEIKETPNAVAYAQQELEGLGRLKLDEKILLAVFVLVVSAWITSSFHGVDATVIALAGIAVLLVSGVLAWHDLIDETHAWEVFIWYGGLVMMASALGSTNIPRLFAETVAAGTGGLSWPLALCVLALVFFYAHYTFASITAHAMAMFVPFLLVTIAIGAPAAITVLVLTFFANLSAGLTHYGTTPAPIYFGLGYVTQRRWWAVGLIASFINIAIWGGIGPLWWKFIGWW